MAATITGTYVAKRDAETTYPFVVTWHRNGRRVDWAARVRREDGWVREPSGRIDDFEGTDAQLETKVRQLVGMSIERAAG